MLAKTKTKLCLALKQFGAFIIMLHTGDIDLVETSTTLAGNVDDVSKWRQFWLDMCVKADIFLFPTHL